ncbi:MAG: endolytic transglycosylase MltG, partial [Deltaproteobacteria bacterium]|nr:endolytic transglycosylase MltG [Nannocystaceae bacterium]
GASFPQTLDLLVYSGVIPADDALEFRLFVLHKGAARKVTAGAHHFRGDMTAIEVLDELQRKQQRKTLKVTVPEGKQMLEVAAILAEAGLAGGDAKAIEAAMRDKTALTELGIPGETAEGYLFPDTYQFNVDDTPAAVVAKLVARHQGVYADLRRNYREEAQDLADDLSFDDNDIVTLASIVEMETAAKHERPLIAGVFLNRLRFSSFKPKRLETDPTIIYGCTVPAVKSTACQSFEGRIRRIHLRDEENPYNTYTHEGLPPGPITNPGKAALEAVFAPKKSKFLYFVARNDGTHQFSKSVAEHEAAVDLYMRKGAVGDGSAAGSVDE